MTTLTYRGKNYTQQIAAISKPAVELSYRRSIYKARQCEAKKDIQTFTYRGQPYKK